jgi:hypothetical protein
MPGRNQATSAHCLCLTLDHASKPYCHAAHSTEYFWIVQLIKDLPCRVKVSTHTESCVGSDQITTATAGKPSLARQYSQCLG